MAEILDKFDFEIHCKYPWKIWTDGQIYKAYEGEDYQNFHAFRHILYVHADRKSMRVRVSRIKKEKAVVFQFYPEITDE